MKKTIVVGITIFVKADGTFGLYENGLRQNVIFLYNLFKSLGAYRPYLLNHGEANPSEDISHLGVDMSDVVRTQDVIGELDCVIGIGAMVERETLQELRSRGVKLICYKGGNGGVISMEGVACNPSIRADAERYYDYDCYDAIWMTPQHIKTYKGWCETMYRCPVYEVPQIWSPAFINTRPAGIVDNFMYSPGKQKWHVAVMEPNITIMKTAHMPILVSDSAYNIFPDMFNGLLVTNALEFSENGHFATFCSSLKIFKDGLGTVENRYVSADFLANHTDAVVTHQWENGLNYLYYEILYGGYPLVHNSKFIKDFGYYYNDFDAESGGAALVRAFKEHDKNLMSYKLKVAKLLELRNPESIFSKDCHKKLIEMVMN